jgi:hypothetical protein
MTSRARCGPSPRRRDRSAARSRQRLGQAVDGALGEVAVDAAEDELGHVADPVRHDRALARGRLERRVRRAVHVRADRQHVDVLVEVAHLLGGERRLPRAHDRAQLDAGALAGSSTISGPCARSAARRSRRRACRARRGDACAGRTSRRRRSARSRPVGRGTPRARAAASSSWRGSRPRDPPIRAPRPALPSHCLTTCAVMPVVIGQPTGWRRPADLERVIEVVRSPRGSLGW